MRVLSLPGNRGSGIRKLSFSRVFSYSVCKLGGPWGLLGWAKMRPKKRELLGVFGAFF